MSVARSAAKPVSERGRGASLRGFRRAASLAARPALQHLLEIVPGVALGRGGDLLGRADGHDLAAGVSAFGAEIDDPVGGLDHFEIVLDHHHGVALVDQLVQHLEQLGHVVEMKPGGRLVENIERAPGGALGQLLGELDPLRLAARERGRLLADMDVAEADAGAPPAPP
jgi:hypothetical protein